MNKWFLRWVSSVNISINDNLGSKYTPAMDVAEKDRFCD